MAKNFSITSSFTNGILFLKLDGDFDGASAFDLLIHLKERCAIHNKIVIDTEALERIICFGIEVWKKQQWMIKGIAERITFRGSNASYFTGEEERYLGEYSYNNSIALLGIEQ